MSSQHQLLNASCRPFVCVALSLSSVQAAHLLQADKKLVDKAKGVFTSCSKLNSRQMATILHHCSVAEGEHAVGVGFTDEMIRLAKVHTDEMLLNSGMELNLEEDPNLELKFHIPQQGYVSDSIWGIPPGLQDYLDPLISAGKFNSTSSRIEFDLRHDSSPNCLFPWEQYE